MIAFVASMMLAVQPVSQPPVKNDLDTLTLADTRQFNGRLVIARFTADAPFYTRRPGGKLATLGSIVTLSVRMIGLISWAELGLIAIALAGLVVLFLFINKIRQFFNNFPIEAKSKAGQILLELVLKAIKTIVYLFLGLLIVIWIAGGVYVWQRFFPRIPSEIAWQNVLNLYSQNEKKQSRLKAIRDDLPIDSELAWESLLAHYSDDPEARAQLEAIRDRLSQSQKRNDKAQVIEAYFDAIDKGEADKTAFKLIHQARHAEIAKSLPGWSTSMFAKRYTTTRGHYHMKITPVDERNPTQPTYRVECDVTDLVARNDLYQNTEQPTRVMYERELVNEDKLVKFVYANVERYFVCPKEDKELEIKLARIIAENRLMFIFSPLFIEELGSDLNLMRKSGPGVRDTVSRHFVFPRVTLMKEGEEWKIRRGLESPWVAIYGANTPIPSK